MGKTILLYLSMSLAFMPKSLSGGACGAGGAGGGGAGGQPETGFINIKFLNDNCNITIL